MRRNTHIVGGLTLALILEGILFEELDTASIRLITDLGLYYSFSVIGSLFPDIDKESSSMGKKFPTVSKAINKTFGHRTITHSILFVILTYYLLYYFNINEYITKGFVVGLTSHILLDLLNFQGVCLLYPLKNRYCFSKIRTSSRLEKYFQHLMVVILFVFIIYR